MTNALAPTLADFVADNLFAPTIAGADVPAGLPAPGSIALNFGCPVRVGEYRPGYGVLVFDKGHDTGAPDGGRWYADPAALTVIYAPSEEVASVWFDPTLREADFTNLNDFLDALGARIAVL